MSADPTLVTSHLGERGEHDVAEYDRRQRRWRDRGRLRIDSLLRHEITQGHVLEIGPGPGYVGLEWLKRTEATRLTALDVSADMVATAQRNAREYGLSGRALYVHGNARQMPFGDSTFDACWSRNSLHEWSLPRATFDEIWRVLKPQGQILLSDLRRDILPPLRWLLWASAALRGHGTGWLSSVRAAYSPADLSELIKGTALENCRVWGTRAGVWLSGTK